MADEPAPATPTTTAAAASSGGCIEVDADVGGGQHVTLEGRVIIDTTFQHPVRGKTRPYILHLDTPRCAVGIDANEVTELHLASSDGVELKPLVGRHVRVSGDPFVSHTAWHARPIVLMTTTATVTPR